MDFVHKFIKIVMMRIFEYSNVVDIEVYEMTGFTRLEDMANLVADRVCRVLTSAQRSELEKYANRLMDLCLEHKDLRESYQEDQRILIQDKLHDHVINSYQKISEIMNVEE